MIYDFVIVGAAFDSADADALDTFSLATVGNTPAERRLAGRYPRRQSAAASLTAPAPAS